MNSSLDHAPSVPRFPRWLSDRGLEPGDFDGIPPRLLERALALACAWDEAASGGSGRGSPRPGRSGGRFEERLLEDRLHWLAAEPGLLRRLREAGEARGPAAGPAARAALSRLRLRLAEDRGGLR